MGSAALVDMGEKIGLADRIKRTRSSSSTPVPAGAKTKSAMDTAVKRQKPTKATTTTNNYNKKRTADAPPERNSTSDIENPSRRRLPKRAASCSNFKEREKPLRLNQDDYILPKVQQTIADDEQTAIQLTRKGDEEEEQTPQRRLMDFIIHDSDGTPQPFEMSEVQDLYISALILPAGPTSSTDKNCGACCEGFGRIESWSISGYDEGKPLIWVSTDLAEYSLLKPSSQYKKHFDIFSDKALLSVEVFKKLSKFHGGYPLIGLDELLASLARALGSRKGGLTRDFIISQGEFVANQLYGLDSTSSNNDQVFAGLPVLTSWRNECQMREPSCRLTKVKDGSLKIGNGLASSASSSPDVMEDESEKMARLLQEEEVWREMKQKKGHVFTSSKSKKYYVKINEDEIVNDYPLPAFYKASEEEMDEYVFFDEDLHTLAPDDLPRRMLHNWALYNSDSRLVSLELLPMLPGTETDVTIFGSGSMTEDDGSGFCIDVKGPSGSSSNGALDEVSNKGIPVYLSAVKEWMIEFGASMLFISIRTDGAWYRLGKPSKQYAPWYEPVLRTATLAIGIITMLKEQSRVSRLSFNDVIRKLSELPKGDPICISSNQAAVERYVVVHGQIILQQFAEFPDENIRKSAFVSGLSMKMEQRHHTKLAMKKKLMLVRKEANMNPRAAMRPEITKKKQMRATTTKLINRIWSDYYSNFEVENGVEPTKGGKEEEDEEVENEENEDEEEEEEEEGEALASRPISNGGESAFVKTNSSNGMSKPSTTSNSQKSNGEITRWVGDCVGKVASSGNVLYKSASILGDMVLVGGFVIVEPDSYDELPAILFVEYMFENSDGVKMIHGRLMQRGSQTVLGNAANAREVFLTDECMDVELSEVKQSVVVDVRQRPWGQKYRKENEASDKVDKARAEEMEKKGLPIEYYCKSLYLPDRGGFFKLPCETMGLGTGVCVSCSCKEGVNKEFRMLSDKSGFVCKGVQYTLLDFVYVNPQVFAVSVEQEKFKAGRNVGLRAYVVCQLLEIEVSGGSKKVDSIKTTKLKVRRFYRPEDIGTEKAYTADIREVYYSEEICTVPLDMLEGKCEVRKQHDLPSLHGPVTFDHIFFCLCVYDPVNGSVKQLPSGTKLRYSKGTLSGNGKNKGKAVEGESPSQKKSHSPNNCLATLDIFAGCGGLSEGLQKSGVGFTKWAIEYEEPAAEAFKLNHPEAHVFCDNCNVILRAIMEKCGDIDDCICTPEAADHALKLSEDKKNNLPLPGQVDFINGGPPCQGFSGMNRFNQSTWSKVQCEMILSFLSYADYFRPRFFLLENVRNFVAFNKGQTFRLTLASLLEMGYQVRFGVLEAGNYGVAQSRKRAFIWAASPNETLPEWPEPMHVFASPQLKITLSDDSQFSAVRSTSEGAPFRSMTVRDTIGDLPPVGNGADKVEIKYGSDPASWFQKQIRLNEEVLIDHVTKEMNGLNFIRCQKIPKRPGADWRDLPDEKVKLSNGQLVDLIPWCLPNTSERHNQWKGLFGRLDWQGNFPTSITDPQPMGKVGMCFHPDQDRILTVRECARSQGFPDSYRFCGNIHNKYRQIGNAVPPPLAMVLGRKLKEALDAKARTFDEPRNLNMSTI
ncbi:DNA (cytosine-5)-methyltransferase 1B [Amborella trichopoda]|nr:DNA (cytosine-5)-methyltransferase 1B [Amborella trichopoda]|eukprot:XP_006847211.2 DNA (cytosine-5)-methyltransferase 1B [Amborella trichopoda]